MLLISLGPSLIHEYFIDMGLMGLGMFALCAGSVYRFSVLHLRSAVVVAKFQLRVDRAIASGSPQPTRRGPLRMSFAAAGPVMFLMFSGLVSRSIYREPSASNSTSAVFCRAAVKYHVYTYIHVFEYWVC